MKQGRLLINGIWQDGSGPMMTAEDPRTGAVVWQGRTAAADDVDAAVAAARAAFPGWAGRSRAERRQIVLAFKAVVEANRDALQAAIVADTGKPEWEAATEVASIIGKVGISITAEDQRCPERADPQPGGGAVTAALRHRPHGVCAVFGPYNFPGHLPNGHIVPALLAGNVVLFKPSELTPLTAEVMAGLWQQAGLPAGVLALLPGDRETGKALAAHPGLDGLFFTGSAAVGRQLARQMADRPGVSLALEMGGNNPLVAWDVADRDAAARLVVQSAFQSAGQRCTCARRLIVADTPAGQALIDAVVSLSRRLIVAPEARAGEVPFMGPLISNPSADMVLKAEDRAISQGAVALLRARRPVADRPFLTPSILDVTHQHGREDEEVFGPLLSVIRVADFGAALEEANRTRYGLAAGLVSDDRTLWDRFVLEARAGVVNWNRPLTGASSALPFGGVGESGNLRPSAAYAADYCAYPVASLEAATVSDLPLPQGVR